MRVVADKNGKITLHDFSSPQAYKIAVKMEEDGIAFYAGLVKQVKDEEARREIGFLIEQEREHQRTFRNLLDREKEGAGDDFEEDDIVQYLKSKVFDASQEPKAAKKADHHHTSLEEALNMERRSIVFYEGCLARTTQEDARQAFLKIIEEEKRHLAKFTELLRSKCINSSGGCVL